MYNNSKIFRPIILLNILGKLIEKVINNRLQAHFIALNFIYLNQMKGIRQWLTTDSSIYLILELKILDSILFLFLFIFKT